MSVDSNDLAQYEGKRVILTVTGVDEPIEGKAEKANALGVLLKPKGKTNLDLIEAGTIVAITLAEETVKAITAKTLKLVELGFGRTHLLERHGLTLTEANALTEEGAFEYHSGTDHVVDDLGHVHGVKASTEKAAALEEKAAAEAVAAE